MTTSAQTARPKFGTRVLALLVDYALILGWMAALAVVTLVLFAITGEFFTWLTLGTVGAQFLGFVLLVLPVGVYFFVCEASPRQATVGKRALGLSVVTAHDDGRPSRARILLRTVVKLLPWEIAHFAVWNLVALTAAGDTVLPAWLLAVLTVADLLPVVYVGFVAFQKDRRGLHDLAAGTRVVARRAFVPEPAGLVRESAAARVTP